LKIVLLALNKLLLTKTNHSKANVDTELYLVPDGSIGTNSMAFTVLLWQCCRQGTTTAPSFMHGGINTSFALSHTNSMKWTTFGWDIDYEYGYCFTNSF